MGNSLSAEAGALPNRHALNHTLPNPLEALPYRTWAFKHTAPLPQPAVPRTHSLLSMSQPGPSNLWRTELHDENIAGART